MSNNLLKPYNRFVWLNPNYDLQKNKTKTKQIYSSMKSYLCPITDAVSMHHIIFDDTGHKTALVHECIKIECDIPVWKWEMGNEKTIVLYVKELCKDSQFVIHGKEKNNSTKVLNNIVVSKRWQNCPFCVNYLWPTPWSSVTFSASESMTSSSRRAHGCPLRLYWGVTDPYSHPPCPKPASKFLWAMQEKATHAIQIQPISSGCKNMIMCLCAWHI